MTGSGRRSWPGVTVAVLALPVALAGCPDSHGRGRDAGPDARAARDAARDAPPDASVDAGPRDAGSDACYRDPYAPEECAPTCEHDCECIALRGPWLRCVGAGSEVRHCTASGTPGGLCIPFDGPIECPCNGGTCDTTSGCCFRADGTVARWIDPECADPPDAGGG